MTQASGERSITLFLDLLEVPGHFSGDAVAIPVGFDRLRRVDGLVADTRFFDPRPDGSGAAMLGFVAMDDRIRSGSTTMTPLQAALPASWLRMAAAQMDENAGKLRSYSSSASTRRRKAGSTRPSAPGN